MNSPESISNLPMFILKLWKLVTENVTNDVISWTKNGTSFIIKNQVRFAKELLPKYFKHNKIGSFIRQLNLYGFRKVPNVEYGGLMMDADEVEYCHQFFTKDHEEQLQFIKRKSYNNNNGHYSQTIVKLDECTDILSDVESMKIRQDSVDAMLNSLKRENEALWREVAILRQKDLKQQQVVEKLIQFIANIVRDQCASSGTNRKAHQPVNCQRKILKPNNDGVKVESSDGSVISYITDLNKDDLAAFLAGISLGQQQNRALGEEMSHREPAGNSDNPMTTMVSLPNSILDLDLNDGHQQMIEDPETSNTLPPEYLLSLTDHVDGLDGELNWFQDQLYDGAALNPETSISANSMPRAIMDGAEFLNTPHIKMEDTSYLFDQLDLENLE